MSDTQDAGTATHEAGETQNADTSQVALVEGTDAPAEKPADAAEEDATKVEAPAEIDYTFDAPEGVELDKTQVEEFKALAKELKLPKDAAQKVVDLAVKAEQARAEAFAQQVSDWGAQVKADKELGSDENLAIARKTIDTFGTPELKSLLSQGWGNHPEFVRLALKVGKAISEDKIVGMRNTAGTPARDPASVLYGTSPAT